MKRIKIMQLMSIFVLLTFFTLAGNTEAGELQVGRFSAADLTGWVDKPFKGRTDYAIVSDNGVKVLKAHSKRSASGLIKEITIDTKTFPIINWSWKVERSLKREDVTKKNGDDFAARVYVVFPRTFFWRMRAINYVWAHKMPKESHAQSPYTGNNMIIAVESGDNKAGTWVKEQRNIYEDYRRVFAEEPPSIGAIAVMTDTDDTEDEVSAYYGDIFLSGSNNKASP